MTHTVLMTLWNPMAAGAPAMAAAFAEQLCADGHRVVLAHGPAPEGAETVIPRFEALDAPIVRLPPLRGIGLVRGMQVLHRAVVEHDVEAVVGFQQRDRALAVLSARLHGLPSVIHCGAPIRLTGTAFVRRAKALAHRAAVGRWVDLVVCPSPAVLDSAIEVLRVGPERTRTIYNGVDTAAMRRSALDGRIDHESSAPARLLCVGRFNAQKGQDVLLEALAEVPGPGERWILELVGGRTSHDDPGGFAAALEATLAQPVMASGVRQLGWRTDVPSLLGRCDVYVQPSRSEGWSLALSEALAAGCAVVFTDCSGPPPGFVDGHHGWMVPTGNPIALRAAIEGVLALSPEARRSVGDAAAELAAEELDLERCTAAFAAAIVETCFSS